MRLSKVLAAVFVLSAFFCGGSREEKQTAVTEKQKGISYACWWPGLYSTPDSDLSLAHLTETGANWIALIVTRYQENLASTRIFASESTPSDADLIHVLTQAHALGLKVMLKPHLDLWNDPSHWRGQIGASFATEAEWEAWFTSYGAFIEHYADLAAAHAADQFCVGTELEGTSRREAEWSKVIAGVRARYPGPLIYAGNHSGEEMRVAWWDAVDIIGIDAYYPLASKPDPSVEELKAAWRPRISELSRLAERWQKPIILTEIGYRSLDGAASHPWDWQISGQVDLQEQEDCYRAAFESSWDQPWLAGIFWWSWGPDPHEGGPTDSGYTPHDKLAEDVLRAWYAGTGERRPRLEPEPDAARTMEIFTDGLTPGWEDWSWDAEQDLEASDQVHRGKAAVRARLDPWGGISFGHQVFFSYPYFYLAFSVRSSSSREPQLWAYFHDRTGEPILRVPVNDTRFIEGGKIVPGRWKQVLILLQEMNALRTPLSRLTIQDRSGQGADTFWLDDLRLVGAKWRTGKPPAQRIRNPRVR